MEHLGDFASEFSKPFVICFGLLAKSNISIYNKTKNVHGKLRSLVLAVLFVTLYFSLAFSFGKVFTGKLGFYELANLVSVFVVVTQGVMKGAVILLNLSKVRSVIDNLGTMWRSTGLSRKQVERKSVMLKRLNLFNAVFYWMNILGSWQYLLMPLFETLFRTFVLGEDKLLFPLICSLPFDATRNWLVYLVTYVYQLYSMLHLVYIYAGVEILMIILCSHLATEFELLREEMLLARPTLAGPRYLNNVSVNGRHNVIHDHDDGIYNHDSDAGNGEITEQSEEGPFIHNVIQRHQKLIVLSKLLDDIFNRMIFFNLLFATITICFFGFVAKIARNPTEMLNNLLAVVASMIPIFSLCYYAELLSGASAGVADSAYHNLWYKGDVRYQKSVIFIIARSQRPCCLTSMRYSLVTLKTFTTVLSTTWSYFSLAITMYETDE